MFGDIIQPTHLLFILVVALIVLGPKRLPEVGRSLGRGLRDFRSAMSGVQDEAHEMLRMDPIIDDDPDYESETDPGYEPEPAALPEAPSAITVTESQAPESVASMASKPGSADHID